ncbi:hypothetical protein N9995_00425, partial [bacterium]|nr:hypothetical protein [bacterium]
MPSLPTAGLVPDQEESGDAGGAEVAACPVQHAAVPPAKPSIDGGAGEGEVRGEEPGGHPAATAPSAGATLYDAPDTLQDPREQLALGTRPVASLRSRSQRELEPQGSQRELEMQELQSPERDRAEGPVLGQDNTSRLRKLHSQLERVVHRHELEKVSVQRWGAWLHQLCTLGNLLQAACAGVMFFSLFLSGGGYQTDLIVALILCGSLVLLLWVQHVTFKRRGMMLGSRARRFLSQLEWYIKNPFDSSTFGSPAASGANVWVQTSRPISAVQVASESGSVVLPTQLLVSGDRIAGPTDHWLVDGYCECMEMSDAVVRDTPSATQLQKVLSQPRRPLSQLDVQINIVKQVVQWALVCALLLSVLSSAILVFVNPGMSSKETLYLAVVRHVPVCVPLLPISLFLSSAVVHIACNAYLAAKIQYKYNLRAGASTDSDGIPKDPDDEAAVAGSKPATRSFWRWIPLHRMRAGLGSVVTGPEADQAPMINGEGDTDRAPHGRKATRLDWRSVRDHTLQVIDCLLLFTTSLFDLSVPGAEGAPLDWSRGAPDCLRLIEG